MNHNDRNVDLLQVLSQIGLGEDFDTIVGILESAHGTLLPPAPDLALADLGALTVEAEERPGGDVDEELRSVFFHGSPETVKDTHLRALGVGVGFEHQRRDGA